MEQKNQKIRIGITGQAGFIGTHLYNYLGLHPHVERIFFEDDYFSDGRLNKFVSSCDAIVHLAAMNRHSDPKVIYDTNIKLVKQIIEACESTNSTPHIFFSSSTQEEHNNLYGQSKHDGRKLFENWAVKNNSKFTGLIVPNVFGPFGKPYYNSFIATFCYQLTHNEQPKIDIDNEVKLIYVGELIKKIFDHIMTLNASKIDNDNINTVPIPHTSQVKVSEVLRILENYRNIYLTSGILPNLDNEFEKNLFNTFLCYVDHDKFFPFYLKQHSDNRGSFVETIVLNSGGQVSFSTTVPGITRGNHFHTRKAERFVVIKGKARIELRKIGTDNILTFELNGDAPSFVDMPIWYTHNITNIGEDELYTVFWINEHYNSNDPDTYTEEV